MRPVDEVIREAKLLASTHETVAAYLEERAERLKKDSILEEGDQAFEAGLLARNSPLINLTLAQFCRYQSTAQAIFFAESATKAEKYAVLSNQVVGGSIFGSMPLDLFDSDKPKLASYLASADSEEILALFQNPRICDDFLKGYLEGDECWQALDESRQIDSLHALARNARITTPYDRSFMDGYAEYSYNNVFSAIWKLAETLPVSMKSASALKWLFDKTLVPHASIIKEPLEVAKRWLPTTPDLLEKEQEEGKCFITAFQGVRAALVKLPLAGNASLIQSLLENTDAAIRAGAYAYGDLSAEQITQAYAKDGEMAFNQLIYNKLIWKKAETRQALHDVAWSVVNNDEYSDLMAANLFEDFRKIYANDHPDWFKDDEEYTPEPSEKPATKKDLQEFAAAISKPVLALENLNSLLEIISSRVGWVWWFSLGALVATLWR